VTAAIIAGHDLGRRVLMFPIIAARMETQARGAGQDGDAAVAEIGFGQRAVIGCDMENKRRARRKDRSIEGTSRVAKAETRRVGAMLVFAGVPWETEEGARFVEDVGEAGQPAMRAIRSRRSPN